MLTGFKGVKYGLQVPKQEARAGPKKPLAAFADADSDDEESVARAIERQAQRKQADSKVVKLQEATLAEDPSIFDYDGHFDDIQERRDGPKAAERKARKSKYIEALLDKAKERQKEQDIVYERRLINERKAEDHLFGDKERFLTAAYKRKLEEDKKWLEEEAMREQIEAAQDVRRRGHMGDFYRNLLTNNESFGTATAKGPKSEAAATASQSQASGIRESGGAAQAAAEFKEQPKDARWEELRRAREAYEAKTLATSSRDAEGAVPASKASESVPEAAAAAGASNAGPSTDLGEKASAEEAAEGEPPAEVPPTLTKEEKAAAARERYLARKRKAPA